ERQIDSLITKARMLSHTNYDSAKTIISKAYLASKKISYHKGLIRGASTSAYWLITEKKLDSAKLLIEYASELASKIDDPNLKAEIFFIKASSSLVTANYMSVYTNLMNALKETDRVEFSENKY